ncbi:energy-coupling factor transporter transmembrane component T [Levilactobacillus sp. HBUAS70063]|uniref:energy-coupling factor transporter transmembrane component T n=1 Tax=Levilactobacillus sp. HBUAS70063 TaxID=3109359 RepID=UPI003132E401
MNGGTVASQTFFNQLHPATLAGYFVALFTILLLFNHLIVAGTLFLSIVGLNSWYFSWQRVRGLLKGTGAFMLTILLFNVLLNQRGSVLWQASLGPVSFRLTRTGVLYGLTMAIMLGAMILTFVLLNGILTTPKISYLLFPVVPRLAMLLTISMRLVTLFTQKFHRLMMLQKTRGLIVTEGAWTQRIRKTGKLMRILLIDSISGSMETAVLMEARGFGARRRSHYQTYHWRAADGWFLGGALILLVIAIYLRWAGWGWTTNVYHLSLSVTTDWLLTLPVLGLAGLPLLGEGVYHLWEN